MNSETLDLRKEGAEELRQEILQELNELVNKAWSRQERQGYLAAIVVVERTELR
jgi:hypothetical protein